jgi:hypothetical protein
LAVRMQTHVESTFLGINAFYGRLNLLDSLCETTKTG